MADIVTVYCIELKAGLDYYYNKAYYCHWCWSCHSKLLK